MDELAQFKFDRLRQLAAVGVQPAHAVDLQRLLKIVVFGPEFQFLIVETNDGEYRLALIEKINKFAQQFDLKPTRLQLDSAQHPTIAAMETALQALAQESNLIHIEGGEFWFDIARWQAFNVRREAIAQTTPARLLFWLDTEQIRLFAQHAPDCWAWRSGVFSFLKQAQAVPVQFNMDMPVLDSGNLAQRTARLAQLQEMVNEAIEPEIKIRLLDEMIDLYVGMGEASIALDVLGQKKMPLLESGFDGAEKYQVSLDMQIADIDCMLGEFNSSKKRINDDVLQNINKTTDQALWIHAQETLAEIEMKLGKPQNALYILRDEVLPLLNTRGEQRHALFVLHKMAKALHMVGGIEQSLRILQKQALPEALAMDDQYLVAHIRFQIAVGLSTMKKYSEALHILRADVLPTYFVMRMQQDVIRVQIEIARIMRMQGKAETALAFLASTVAPLIQASGGEDVSLLSDFILEMAYCQTDMGHFLDANKMLGTRFLTQGKPGGSIPMPPQMQEKLDYLLQRIQDAEQSKPTPEQPTAPSQSTT